MVDRSFADMSDQKLGFDVPVGSESADQDRRGPFIWRQASAIPAHLLEEAAARPQPVDARSRRSSRTRVADRDPMARYFSGEVLYGDDFGPEQLAQWCATEQEAYAQAVHHEAGQSGPYRYKYHGLNRAYGFRHVAGRSGLRVLGIGSAYGDELEPIAPQAASFDIVEPSDAFTKNRLISGVPATYHKPRPDGLLDFPDDSFDVITAFAALHHVANVSTVVRECRRVLKPGGMLLCHEPIVSMGDWRTARPRLTPNERGIPYLVFKRILAGAGLRIRDSRLIDFAPLGRLADKLGIDQFGNSTMIALDRGLSILFGFNRKYHRTRTIEKFGPASAFYVAQKTSAEPAPAA